MIIAVSSSGDTPDSPVYPQLGRCPYILFYDTETKEYRAMANLSGRMPSGAGIQVAQMLVSQGVRVVITGSVGPNTYPILMSAGIEVVPARGGTVKEEVEAYLSGRPTVPTRPTQPLGVSPSGVPAYEVSPSEIEYLKGQIRMLKEEIRELRWRLSLLKASQRETY